MKVVGILVCNSEEVLKHKKTDGKRKQGAYCYWDMRRFPTRIAELIQPDWHYPVSEPARAPVTDWTYSEDDMPFPNDVEVRLYFATLGVVRGYFVCKAMGERKGVRELRFHSEDWKALLEFPRVRVKPSQGFRYFSHLVGGESK